MARPDQDAAGRLLERAGDRAPREMTVPAERPDRTRLIGVHVLEAPDGIPAGGFDSSRRYLAAQSTKRSGIMRHRYFPCSSHPTGSTVAARSGALKVRRTSSVGM